MTLNEMRECEETATVVLFYRHTHDFLTSPCWMDEWALGYLCSLRDTGMLNEEQWSFLCGVFQDVESERANGYTTKYYH